MQSSGKCKKLEGATAQPYYPINKNLQSKTQRSPGKFSEQNELRSDDKCFVNLCHNNFTAIPKRKVAIVDPVRTVLDGGSRPEVTAKIGRERVAGETCEVKEKRSLEGRVSSVLEAGTREEQKRKYGLVLGVDPKVDAFVENIKSKATSKLKKKS